MFLCSFLVTSSCCGRGWMSNSRSIAELSSTERQHAVVAFRPTFAHVKLSCGTRSLAGEQQFCNIFYMWTDPQLRALAEPIVKPMKSNALCHPCKHGYSSPSISSYLQLFACTSPCCFAACKLCHVVPLSRCNCP